MNFLLNKSEWVSIGKGALVAGIGAALTYGYQAISSQNLGDLAPIFAAGFAVVANYLRKSWNVPVDTQPKQ